MALPDVLRTWRLVLRPFRTDDAAPIFNRWAQDPEVWRYLRERPRMLLDHTERSVQRAIEGRRQGTAFPWVLGLSTDELPLGFVGLVPEGHMAQLSYMLARDAWGRGYATEAARAVVEAALELPRVYRVWAMCDVDNRASARVLEKVGMEREGTLRRYAVRPNLGPEPRDAHLYARVR